MLEQCSGGRKLDSDDVTEHAPYKQQYYQHQSHSRAGGGTPPRNIRVFSQPRDLKWEIFLMLISSDSDMLTWALSCYSSPIQCVQCTCVPGKCLVSVSSSAIVKWTATLSTMSMLYNVKDYQFGDLCYQSVSAIIKVVSTLHCWTLKSIA